MSTPSIIRLPSSPLYIGKTEVGRIHYLGQLSNGQRTAALFSVIFSVYLDFDPIKTFYDAGFHNVWQMVEPNIYTADFGLNNPTVINPKGLTRSRAQHLSRVLLKKHNEKAADVADDIDTINMSPEEIIRDTARLFVASEATDAGQTITDFRDNGHFSFCSAHGEQYWSEDGCSVCGDEDENVW